MPRGIRKTYQLQYKVWFGAGGSLSEHTTRDLTKEEYIKLLRETAQRFLDIAELGLHDQAAAKSLLRRLSQQLGRKSGSTRKRGRRR